jgi:hypothetical protein
VSMGNRIPVVEPRRTIAELGQCGFHGIGRLRAAEPPCRRFGHIGASARVDMGHSAMGRGKHGARRGMGQP